MTVKPLYFYCVLLLYIGWWFGLAVTHWSRSTSYSTPGLVNTWMGRCLQAGTSSQYVTSHLAHSALVHWHIADIIFIYLDMRWSCTVVLSPF